MTVAASSSSAGAGAGVPRDAQRAKVYAAENLVLAMLDRAARVPVVQVAGSTISLPVERRFASVESVQSYLDAVLELGWVRVRWPDVGPVLVRRRKSADRAQYSRDGPTGPTIAVPTHVAGNAWALRELVVLHELAHHLTDPSAAAHGPEFVGILLDLVDRLVGAEAAFLLRVRLADEGAKAG
jgi:putative metallohydrolase (TIGR04338 family)